MRAAVAVACDDSSFLALFGSATCQPQSGDQFRESFAPVSPDYFPLSYQCREFRATLGSGFGFRATCAATATIRSCALTGDVPLRGRVPVATSVPSDVPTCALLLRGGAADRREIGGIAAAAVVVDVEEVPSVEGLS